MKPVILVCLITFSMIAIISCEDPNDLDTCGDSFTEAEGNDSRTASNDFHIIMKNGCEVTITGTIGPFGIDTDDYFFVNVGSADNIIFILKWSPTPSAVNLSLLSQTGIINSSSGIGSASFFYALFKKHRGRWLRVKALSGVPISSYTLTMKAFTP